MSTVREQILVRIATTLAGTTGVGTRIYRSRHEAFARNEAPAIVIEPSTDQCQTPAVSHKRLDWTLSVTVAVYSRGNIPDQAADPTINSLHAKLLADRTLGGLALDILPVSVVPSFESSDVPSAWTVCTFSVRYRTLIENISQGS